MVGVLALAVFAADACAETLRWNLKAGETYTLDVAQQTTSEVTFSGKKATTQIDLLVVMTWQVTGPAEGNAAEGDAVAGMKIRQSINRVSVKLAAADAPVVAFDTAQNLAPTSANRDIASAISPLVKVQVDLVLSPRGEIVSVEPASDAAKELFAATGKEGTAFSAAAVAKVLKQSLLVLPEKDISPSGTWQQTGMISAAAGKFDQTTTYKLASVEEKEGKKVATIGVSSKLLPAAAANAPPANAILLKQHEQTGKIRFELAAGRLLDAEQTQKLVTERPYRETTIVVSLTSVQKTELRPTAPLAPQ